MPFFSYKHRKNVQYSRLNVRSCLNCIIDLFANALFIRNCFCWLFPSGLVGNVVLVRIILSGELSAYSIFVVLETSVMEVQHGFILG